MVTVSATMLPVILFSWSPYSQSVFWICTTVAGLMKLRLWLTFKCLKPPDSLVLSSWQIPQIHYFQNNSKFVTTLISDWHFWTYYWRQNTCHYAVQQHGVKFYSYIGHLSLCKYISKYTWHTDIHMDNCGLKEWVCILLQYEIYFLVHRVIYLAKVSLQC